MSVWYEDVNSRDQNEPWLTKLARKNDTETEIDLGGVDVGAFEVVEPNLQVVRFGIYE